jgi:hypothetical protein
MYSVLLFLLIVILAPIALRSLFALLMSPLFWGLVILCGLGIGGSLLYAPYRAAQEDAEFKHSRIENLTMRINALHSKVGDSCFNKWAAWENTHGMSEVAKSLISRLYIFMANGGKIETKGFDDQDMKNLEYCLDTLEKEVSQGFGNYSQRDNPFSGEIGFQKDPGNPYAGYYSVKMPR